jgi:hypothetical protein
MLRAEKELDSCSTSARPHVVTHNNILHIYMMPMLLSYTMLRADETAILDQM